MMIDVSIVIVCMNNLDNLYPCLDSIKTQTQKVSYETFVVAYLFSEDKILKLKTDYPWVIIIESNEIRGFSENNNLALRLAKGKYCFVLNDDTYHRESVIDELFDELNNLPEQIAILSPIILNVDGSVQYCGRPKYNLFTYTLDCFRLSFLYNRRSKYMNQKGCFETFNILGAAFMIRSDIFKKMGYFDEYYFFCPEDIALSTKLNENGYKCYVTRNVRLTHIGGGTWSKTLRATKPATIKGLHRFYCNMHWFLSLYFLALSTLSLSFKTCFWFVSNVIRGSEHKKTLLGANKNAIYALFSRLSPKQLFIKYYEKLKKAQ